MSRLTNSFSVRFYDSQTFSWLPLALHWWVKNCFNNPSCPPQPLGSSISSTSPSTGDISHSGPSFTDTCVSSAILVHTPAATSKTTENIPRPPPSASRPPPTILVASHPHPPTISIRIHSMTTRASHDICNPVDKINLHTNIIFSPVTHNYSHAFRDPNWLSVMKDEYNTLISNGTWILVPQTSTINMVDFIWLFKKKLNNDGSIARYKARLVVNGCSCRPIIDCEDTFSLVVKPLMIITILSISISYY